MNKIVVVGCGNVGMAYSYALINQRVFVTNCKSFSIIRQFWKFSELIGV